MARFAALTSLARRSLPFLRSTQVVECLATNRTSHISNTEPVVDTGIMKDMPARQ